MMLIMMMLTTMIFTTRILAEIINIGCNYSVVSATHMKPFLFFSFFHLRPFPCLTIVLKYLQKKNISHIVLDNTSSLVVFSTSSPPYAIIWLFRIVTVSSVNFLEKIHQLS